MTVHAKYRVDAVIKIEEADASSLQHLDAAVHAGCLSEQVMMKHSHAFDIEARVQLATEKSPKALVEQVRLAKAEVLAAELA